MSALDRYTNDLPYEFDESIGSKSAEVFDESVMPKKEADRLFNIMCAKWGITENAEKQFAHNTVLKYFVMNGTSPYVKFSSSFVVGGKTCPHEVIREVLAGRIRQFARAFVSYVFHVIMKDDEFAYEAAEKWGVDPAKRQTAFDFYDKLKNKDPQDAAYADDKKAARIASSKSNGTHGGAGPSPPHTGRIAVDPYENSGAVQSNLFHY